MKFLIHTYNQTLFFIFLSSFYIINSMDLIIPHLPIELQGIIINDWIHNQSAHSTTIRDARYSNNNYIKKNLLVILVNYALFSEAAAKGLLHYEINRIRKNPKNIFSLNDQTVPPIFFFTWYIDKQNELNEKEKGEKKQLIYQKLCHEFDTNTTITTFFWQREFCKKTHLRDPAFMPIITGSLNNYTITISNDQINHTHSKKNDNPLRNTLDRTRDGRVKSSPKCNLFQMVIK